MDGAVWSGQDEFPSSQLWADEVERVLAFTVAQGQFPRYLGALRGRKNQFESALLELRVAFFLHRNSFKIVGWEPVGNGGNKGEYLVQGPSGTATFVEVKSPGWESELFEEELIFEYECRDCGAKFEKILNSAGGKVTCKSCQSPRVAKRKAGRLSEPKHLNFEARAVAPWTAIQFAVGKAYKKFASDTPNLLIIADDLFVSLQHGTDLIAGMALYEGTHACFVDKKYENTGGVGIFWIENDGRQIWYEMRLFLNPNAQAVTMLPDDMRLGFHGQGGPPAERGSMAAWYAGETPFQRWLREGV
jgi:DNA-directed RNA polymerase subunit RPC12/RpoP